MGIARRRQKPVRRQRCEESSRQCERENRAGTQRLGCTRPKKDRQQTDRARWHAEQKTSGRKRAAGSFTGGGARCRGCGKSFAVSLPRWTRGKSFARADDEHLERLRAVGCGVRFSVI